MPNMLIEPLGKLDQLPAVAFLDRISDFAILLSPDGRSLQHVNSHTTDVLGWSRGEVEQFSPWWPRLLNDASASALFELLKSLAQANFNDFARPELRLAAKTSGGLHVPLDVHTIFFSEESSLLLARSPLSRESAEEILRQTQARFRSIVDSLSINLVLKSIDGRRVYANRAYLEMRQQSLADIVGKTDADLFPPDLAAQYQADDEKVLQSGEVIHKFEQNIGPNGARSWTETIKGPLRDADDNITGVQILFWDATARKATEAAYERERHLLHTLLDNVPDSIYFKDRQSRFVRISRGMANKFNLAGPEVAIGKTDADIFTGEHADKARQDELQIMRTGQPLIARVERETWPDRPDSWCSTTKLPLYDPNGRVVGTFGISRDVTD
ncbi:MAG: PAS domain-containing protein, partial [Planctomycetales bacterium]|nr:PAS domain-containing protein [Planctomycetales bacterium]